MPQSNPPILLTDPPATMPEEGTEDYELLFAAPDPLPEWVREYGVLKVGRVEAGDPGVQFVSAGGDLVSGAPYDGWDPFK